MVGVVRVETGVKPPEEGVEPNLFKGEDLRPGALALSRAREGGHYVEGEVWEVRGGDDVGEVCRVGGVVLEVFNDLLVGDAHGKVEDAQAVVGGEIVEAAGAGELNEVVDVEEDAKMPDLQGEHDGGLGLPHFAAVDELERLPHGGGAALCDDDFGVRLVGHVGALVLKLVRHDGEHDAMGTQAGFHRGAVGAGGADDEEDVVVLLRDGVGEHFAEQLLCVGHGGAARRGGR